jgi:ferredoxin
VDIYRVMQPQVSFLDLTTVIEGQAIEPAIKSVGLILGSTDPIALDTVAQHAIGYEDLTVWTSMYGSAVGLGCNNMDQVHVQGIDWNSFEKKRLLHPAPPRMCDDSLYERVTRFVNHTIFRPRPVIASAACTRCGDCVTRCPVDAIGYVDDGGLLINHGACSDCGCCLSVCDVDAVQLEFVGLAKVARICSSLVVPKLSHPSSP